MTGTDPAHVTREADKIAWRYWNTRRDFDFVVPAGSADWCIAQAIAYPGNAVVISDSGDNPTAGGAGDVPYFIGRLLAHPAFAGGSSRPSTPAFPIRRPSQPVTPQVWARRWT